MKSQNPPSAEIANGPLSGIRVIEYGMMYLPDDQAPSLIHMAVLDQAAAITASHAILAALFARERHGVAQAVHTSLYSAGLWLMYCNLFAKSVLNRDTAFAWKRYENPTLRNSIQCSDGEWLIGVHHPEEKYWERFCEITGQHAGEVLDDPQALANDYVVEFEHPMHSRIKLQGYPASSSEAKAQTQSVASVPDEHSREILLELGYSEEDLAELRRQDVIR